MQAFADKLAVPCAYAVPTLTLADSLATITIQDGDALDADHLLNGVVSYSGTVGYWTLDFTTGATMPQFMNLSGEMSGTVADQLYIIFDESGFGPYSGNLRADVSGTIADGSTGTFLANADG